MNRMLLRARTFSSQAIRQSFLVRTAITFATVLAAAALQESLWDLIRPAPFVLFYPAVILSSLYGNGPLSILLSAGLAQAFFVSDPGDPSLSNFVRVLTFCCSAGSISWLAHRMQKALDGAITERQRVVRAEADRSRLLDELKAAVSTRDEFISIASHELKTPVTSMKLQFQMAKRRVERGDARVYEPAEVNRRLVLATRQLDRMADLLDDILDVSRIRLGKLHVDLKAEDLADIAANVAEQFTDPYAQANTELTVVLERPLPVMADRFRLEQVISNLLSNALRYGKKSPTRLQARREGDQVLVVVSDEGEGIARDDLTKIFERFERVSPQKHSGGLGLGLFICREIVKMHGGRIWAESEAGRGASFYVRLPLAATEAL